MNNLQSSLHSVVRSIQAGDVRERARGQVAGFSATSAHLGNTNALLILRNLAAESIAKSHDASFGVEGVGTCVRAGSGQVIYSLPGDKAQSRLFHLKHERFLLDGSRGKLHLLIGTAVTLSNDAARQRL